MQSRAELQTCVMREVNPVTRHAISTAARVVSAAAGAFLNACHLQTDMGTVQHGNTHAPGQLAAHFKIQMLRCCISTFSFFRKRKHFHFLFTLIHKDKITKMSL